jgi:hypothetical protein
VRFLEHESELQRVISAPIQEQRRFAVSSNLAVRFRTLWTVALLKKHLTNCTDHEVAKLMIIVQRRFHIFEPEFALCHHAMCRLQLLTAKEKLTK